MKKIIINLFIIIIIIILLIYSYKYRNSMVKINALNDIPMNYIISNENPNKDIINLTTSETLNMPVKDLLKTPIIGKTNKDIINTNINKINKNINTSINTSMNKYNINNIDKIRQEQEDILEQTKVEFDDIKQLLHKQNEIITKQTELLDKQSKLLDKIPLINKITHNKYDDSIIEHKNENIEVYFKQLRASNDTKIVQENDIDFNEYYKDKVKYIKSYLEDPETRGYNIYESEQFSKLLDIGNIKVNDKVEPIPHPTNYAKSLELKKI